MIKLFFHFSVFGFSNTYLIGPDGGGNAILVDPGTFDLPLLQLIEKNNFYVRHILITHNHSSHTAGIKTLMKVYDAQIYCNNQTIMDFPAQLIGDGDELDLDGLMVKVLAVPGHSGDSLVFSIGKHLFTGDVLSAGRIGSTASPYLKSMLLDSITTKILKLKGHFNIYPGHGPPTTLEIEKQFNPELRKVLAKET